MIQRIRKLQTPCRLLSNEAPTTGNQKHRPDPIQDKRRNIPNSHISRSASPPKLRHPAEPPPLRVRRLNHLPAPAAEPEEDHQRDEHERRHRRAAPHRGADPAAVEVARRPGAGGRREGHELVAAEGVVDQPAEGDGVAGELERGDLLGAEDDGEGNEEDGLEDAGEGEDQARGLADLRTGLAPRDFA